MVLIRIVRAAARCSGVAGGLDDLDDLDGVVGVGGRFAGGIWFPVIEDAEGICCSWRGRSSCTAVVNLSLNTSQ
jgi:hypothetical protein